MHQLLMNRATAPWVASPSNRSTCALAPVGGSRVSVVLN
jgi:hypothetical protein